MSKTVMPLLYVTTCRNAAENLCKLSNTLAPDALVWITIEPITDTSIVSIQSLCNSTNMLPFKPALAKRP